MGLIACRGPGGGDLVAVTWRVSGKVLAEGVTAALALLAAAVTGDVMLVALAAPLGLAVVLALTAGRPDPPAVTTNVSPLVVAQGDNVELSIEIAALAGVGTGRDEGVDRRPRSPTACKVATSPFPHPFALMARHAGGSSSSPAGQRPSRARSAPLGPAGFGSGRRKYGSPTGAGRSPAS